MVTGKVQGVFYRNYCRDKAVFLGITGSVRNRADGAVEIHASGTPEAVEKLRQWCDSGSPLSRVTGVQATRIPFQGFEAFVILS